RRHRPAAGDERCAGPGLEPAPPGRAVPARGRPGQALEHARESTRIVEHGRMADQTHESLALMARIHSALGNAAQSRAWSDRARLHLAEAGRERDPNIGAALDADAPRPEAWIDQLGSLTRARIIGVLA